MVGSVLRVVHPSPVGTVSTDVTVGTIVAVAGVAANAPRCYPTHRPSGRGLDEAIRDRPSCIVFPARSVVPGSMRFVVLASGRSARRWAGHVRIGEGGEIPALRRSPSVV